MNEVNVEFYKELVQRLNAAEPEEREQVFAEVHEKYGINPDEAHQQNLNAWAIRMQCAPEAMLEQIDNVAFSPTLNMYEYQAILMGLSPHGRELIGSPDLPVVATFFMSALQKLEQAASASGAQEAFDELNAHYSDDMIAIADGYAKAAEEADDE